MTDGDGRLIAVCGIDGSGKTTVIESIAAELGERVLVTRQPTELYRSDPLVRGLLDGGPTTGLMLRELALLAAFDRLRHVRTTILPAVAEGRIVVCDRYVYSTYAYFLARGITDLAWLTRINDAVPAPDLAVYLDVDPVVAAERIVARDGSSRKREELDLDRMSRVRGHFLTRPWGEEPWYHIVDARQNVDAVTAEVLALVRKVAT